MEKKPDRSEIITMTLLFALTLVLTVLKVTSKSDESGFAALVVGAGSALAWHISVLRLGLLALGDLSQLFFLFL